MGNYYDIDAHRPTEEQIAKLPGYMQTYLRNLEGRLAELEKTKTAEEKTRLAFEPSMYGARLYLPEDFNYSQVCYDMTSPEFDSRKIRDEVSIRRGHTFYSGGEPKELETSLTLRADNGRLEVLPKQRSEIIIRYVAE